MLCTEYGPNGWMDGNLKLLQKTHGENKRGLTFRISVLSITLALDHKKQVASANRMLEQAER